MNIKIYPPLPKQIVYLIFLIPLSAASQCTGFETFDLEAEYDCQAGVAEVTITPNPALSLPVLGWISPARVRYNATSNPGRAQDPLRPIQRVPD